MAYDSPLPVKKKDEDSKRTKLNHKSTLTGCWCCLTGAGCVFPLFFSFPSGLVSTKRYAPICPKGSVLFPSEGHGRQADSFLRPGLLDPGEVQAEPLAEPTSGSQEVVIVAVAEAEAETASTMMGNEKDEEANWSEQRCDGTRTSGKQDDMRQGEARGQAVEWRLRVEGREG